MENGNLSHTWHALKSCTIVCSLWPSCKFYNGISLIMKNGFIIQGLKLLRFICFFFFTLHKRARNFGCVSDLQRIYSRPIRSGPAIYLSQPGVVTIIDEQHQFRIIFLRQRTVLFVAVTNKVVLLGVGKFIGNCMEISRLI